MKALQFAGIGLCLLALALPSYVAGDEPKYGAIDVTSEPAGARVYIEGFLAGNTPVKVEEVVPGSYRVVVRRDESADFMQDVSVTAGQISRVAAMLTQNPRAWTPAVRNENDWTPVLDKDKDRYEKAKGKAPLRGYKVLEISNFLVKSDEEVPPDHLYAVLRDIVNELDKEKSGFQMFVTSYTRGPSARWKESGPGLAEPTLVLSGVITRYQRGSRAKRYIAGFGAGKTRIYCLFRLVDKKTGDVLLERMENGSISGGFSLFGGASAGAMRELAEDIAHVIKTNW